jgi:hypothetical protein
VGRQVDPSPVPGLLFAEPHVTPGIFHITLKPTHPRIPAERFWSPCEHAQYDALRGRY